LVVGEERQLLPATRWRWQQQRHHRPLAFKCNSPAARQAASTGPHLLDYPSGTITTCCRGQMEGRSGSAYLGPSEQQKGHYWASDSFLSLSSHKISITRSISSLLAELRAQLIE